MTIFDKLCFRRREYESSGDEVVDDDAVGLSHVAQAAYEVLRVHHNGYHHSLWNVTRGVMVGPILVTPRDSFSMENLPPDSSSPPDPPEGHSNWLPEHMAEIMRRTERWCDVTSLSPPDGHFMKCFREAIVDIADRAKKNNQQVVVRLLFGNIVGMPVNCTAVIQELTQDLDPQHSHLQLWVGAWCKGVSWNHSKIIAVDGLYLMTGGHNLCDAHYLQFDPIHDMSVELRGPVAHDGHLYANDQWMYIQHKQSTCYGQCVDKLPDTAWVASKARVTVSEFPNGIAGEFPPLYHKRAVPRRPANPDDIPIITMGRYGKLLRYHRPSDDAFVAMFDAAQSSIKLSLQDLGPLCVPGTKMPVPGTKWPKGYLAALGRAIWERDVVVEIALSNPNSIPGGLKGTEAFGNGWTCVDVAAEIIKIIRRNHPIEANEAALRSKVEKCLRLCFFRRPGGSCKWETGMTLGNHTKHVIVDDVCAYVGSQNLYVCDLAEWGVVIDNAESVQKIMAKFWNPMWAVCFTGEDCSLQDVMDGLDIDRDGERHLFLSPDARKQKKQALARQSGRGKGINMKLRENDETEMEADS